MYEADQYLDTAKRIHFIGIGGSGTVPIVEILHTLGGFTITGSDNNETETVHRVMDLGIPVALCQSADNIGDVDMVVYSGAISPENPELKEAVRRGIPTFERSKMLGALSRKFGKTVGISGTHGKTTVTSMLTQILLGCGMDPSAVIGGKLRLTDTYGVTGKSDIFVCESCEYHDTFLELTPFISVILNVDEDHMEYFHTLDNMKKSFVSFADRAPITLYNGDDANTLDVMRQTTKTFGVTFGLQETNDYYASDVSVVDGAFSRFKVMHSGKCLGELTLRVPGAHNVLNALAALAAADLLGADMRKAIEQAAAFEGAGRRFQVMGVFNGVTIVDDYAHHPAELEATLTAAKEMDFKKVIAVFQPFTFSRTKMHLQEFIDVLKIPDKALLTPIMGGREENTYNVYSEDIASKVPGSEIWPDFRSISDRAEALAEPGDLIITLGCGDINKAAHMMVKDYQSKS